MKEREEQFLVVVASAKAQVKEFVERFEKDFSLVFCISGTNFDNA